MRTQTGASAETTSNDSAVDFGDYPVREYIRAMSLELAQMAFWDGDPALAKVLKGAAGLASVPKVIEAVRDPAPRRKRTS